LDALRYYLAPATTLCGVIGFLLGGDAVWLGLATFPVLLFFDVVLPRDESPRSGVVPIVADFALYLHVVLICSRRAESPNGSRILVTNTREPAFP
jgi:toluene methyl-monooxygenase